MSQNLSKDGRGANVSIEAHGKSAMTMMYKKMFQTKLFLINILNLLNFMQNIPF